MLKLYSRDDSYLFKEEIKFWDQAIENNDFFKNVRSNSIESKGLIVYDQGCFTLAEMNEILSENSLRWKEHELLLIFVNLLKQIESLKSINIL